jgi:photosystem II CP43 chlorophyll apoprotein
VIKEESGLTLMAWTSSAFIGFNITVFPIEFYSADRTSLAATQFFLGVVALIGHLWHSYRARTN